MIENLLIESPAKGGLAIFIFNTSRYFFIAGITYYIFWKVLASKIVARKVSHVKMPSNQIQTEIKYSLSSLVIIALTVTGVYYLKYNGYTQIYENLDDYGTPYFILSFVMTILIHDFYFYITHRLIHHPRLYRKVHAIHHYSLNPSPWASFSFHPFEACVQAGIVVVLAFVMPVHTYALLLFSAFSFSMNIIGHLGYEYYPAWFKKIPIFKNLHSATSHNVHHAKYKGNYGLYFTWWDKLFKTEL